MKGKPARQELYSIQMYNIGLRARRLAKILYFVFCTAA